MRLPKLCLPVMVIIALTLIPSILRTQISSCLECHQLLEEELLASVEAYKLDIHQRKGLSCADCHGGNPQGEDMESAKDKSFRGAPERKDIPLFCARCHSDSQYMRKFNPSLRIDQLALYWTSRHGELLKKGDKKVAVCTDCHAAHGILEGRHPKSTVFPWNIPRTCGQCHSNKDYMKEYIIPTNQEEEYKQSVHASALYEKKDLSAPVCNDCHGNHGAYPPEVESISNVCHQCHPSPAQLFSASPHQTAFSRLGFSECEACHGNHKILKPNDEMLGTGDEATCIQCHEQDSVGYKTSMAMKSVLDEFNQSLTYVQSRLEQAEKQGVEVSEYKFKLIDANSSLIQARNLTHTLNLDKIKEAVEEGKNPLREAETGAEKALKEAKMRKTGLVVATIFILLLAFSLYLKVKQMKREKTQTS